MFNRSTDRSTVEDPRRIATPTLPTTSLRDAVAVPVQGGLGAAPAPALQPAPMAAEESIIAADDEIDGTIKTKRGVRILGAVNGAIEAAQYVHIEENSKVEADVSADEVIIAGQYSGKLTCRQRLEIRATGRVSGQIETVKLMLHEGGYFDGELHMQKPGNGAQSGAAQGAGSRARESSDIRGSGSLAGGLGAASAASPAATSAPLDGGLDGGSADASA